MDKQDKQQKIVAVFQSSASFLSGFYCAAKDGQDRVDDFIESHYESGRFANLETFTDEEEAKDKYSVIIVENLGYQVIDYKATEHLRPR